MPILLGPPPPPCCDENSNVTAGTELRDDDDGAGRGDCSVDDRLAEVTGALREMKAAMEGFCKDLNQVKASTSRVIAPRIECGGSPTAATGAAPVAGLGGTTTVVPGCGGVLTSN